MASLTVSPVEYRSVIKFLLLEGKSAEEILTRLEQAYGSKGPARCTVYKWIAQFKGGRQSVDDNTEGRGRPEEIGQTKLDLCDELVKGNRRICIRELADELCVSKSMCHNMLASLGYRKICSRFVPSSSLRR